MEGINDIGKNGRIMFSLINPSAYILKAKIWCNFKIYGEDVEYHNDFNGTNTWYVYPQQTSRGWYEIRSLLGKKGKSVEDMIKEANATNISEQLTMSLKIQFRDELGNDRTLPERRHYFDFKQWLWIPHLTQKEEW